MKRLSQEQRYLIQGLLNAGRTQEFIANEVGCSQSTISREIDRNSTQKGYNAHTAQKKASERARTTHVHRLYDDQHWERVESLLREDLSPDQIVGRCSHEGVDCPSIEYIYRHIWADKKRGGDLHTHLRQRHPKNYSRSRRNDYRGRIPNLVSIDERPSIVDRRERYGDLEIDLVIGKDHKGKLLTVNDRASGECWIRKLGSKNADEVADTLIEVLNPIKKKLHTITSDNGREFAAHARIAEALGISYYFAHPYHSWERGSNENLNGLIRQYIPKNERIEYLDEEYIAWVEKKLNNRPRKRLDYLTPKEYILTKLKC